MIFIQNKIKNLLRQPYAVLLIIFVYTFIFGFFCDTPENILKGFYNIVTVRCILITDYVAVGGLGATLINVSLTSILVLAIYFILKLKPNGSLLMAFWMCAGFSFFGKDMLNTLPIIFGGFLYAVYKRENFMRYSLPAVLSTTLAPVVNEVYFIGIFNNAFLNFVLAVLAGICVGFVLVPISTNAIKAHSGFNLYNVGFSAGILGILINGTIKGLGLSLPDRPDIWSNNETVRLTIYLVSICLFLIIIGLILTEFPKQELKKIYKTSGRLVTDYYMTTKEASYINMGLNGLFAILVVYLLGAEMNGPTVGAIFTIIGFGCYGKHIKNMYPVILGAIIATLISDRNLSEPAIIIAILFCTGLAPIAGTFGMISGIISGMVHIFIVTNVAIVHGGLNLYNNGFACGFVAMIVVPLIAEFKERKLSKKEDFI